MNKNLKNVLRTLLFLGIGSIILYIVYLKFNANFQEECAALGNNPEDCNFFHTIITYIKSANYFWVFIALIFYMISNVSRSLQWRMLLEPLSHKPRFLNSLATVMIAYLVNLGIPRSGEFVRAGLLAKYEKIDSVKVMGTIVTSRVLDVICLLITFGITLLLSFDNVAKYFTEQVDLHARFGGLVSPLSLSILGLTFILFSLVIWKIRDRIFASILGQKIKKILLGFWEGILSIKELKQPVLFIFHTAVIWICYYLMTYLMFFSFVPTEELAPVCGLVVFVFGTLGIIIPSPGGMGTYQYLISEALMLYGVTNTEAFAFANIMFFSVQLLNIILGVMAFIFLPIYNRNA